MKTYCINIIEREDRYFKMKEQFDKYNMDVTFIRNKKHEKGGIYGCFEAHIMCIKDAISNDLEYCLILEDDNIIINTYKDSIAIAVDFFNNNIDTGIIYLQNRGLLCAYETMSDNIYKCIMYGTSSYILNKKNMHKIILEHEPYLQRNNIHYDQFLMKINYNNTYCCTKYLTISYSSESDNEYNYFIKSIIPYVNIIEPYINTLILSISVPLMKINLLKYLYLNCLLYNMYIK